MSDLHGEIMNIPCDPSRAPVAGVNAELAYKYGHRDARHAAAELAATHGAERAQPAEAEGVDFGFDDRSVKVSQEAYSIFLERERHHLAALSAVTAERDEWKARCQYNADTAYDVAAERDQLRAEVEALRALLSKSLPVVEAHAGASHMLEGFRPIRNKWDELVDGIRAAMAAKEA